MTKEKVEIEVLVEFKEYLRLNYIVASNSS
jgi:hypothetical protein